MVELESELESDSETEAEVLTSVPASEPAELIAGPVFSHMIRIGCRSRSHVSEVYCLGTCDIGASGLYRWLWCQWILIGVRIKKILSSTFLLAVLRSNLKFQTGGEPETELEVVRPSLKWEKRLG